MFLNTKKNSKNLPEKKATERKSKYFVLLNFRKLVWFDTAKVNAMLPEEQQIIQTYTLSDLATLDDLETGFRAQNPLGVTNQNLSKNVVLPDDAPHFEETSDDFDEEYFDDEDEFEEDEELEEAIV